MSLSPTVSIIVPVYNVERYLPRCIDSILAQTFTDFELILTDDGSPDNSGLICDEYAEKDARIRVIHQENGGVGKARNAGLDVAQGDYVCFVDPDDVISPNYLEIFKSSIEEKKTDIVVCAYQRNHIKDDRIIFTEIKNKAPVGSFEDYGSEITSLHKNTLLFMLWNKLFKKTIIDTNHIRFTSHKKYEDAIFIYRYLTFCNSVYFNDEVLYFYSIFKNNTKTATLKYTSDYFSAYYECYLTGLTFYRSMQQKKMESTSEFLKELSIHFTTSLCGDLVVNLSRSPLRYKQRYLYTKQSLQQYHACNIQIKPADFHSTPDKLICFLVNIKAKHLLVFLSFLYSKKAIIF